MITPGIALRANLPERLHNGEHHCYTSSRLVPVGKHPPARKISVELNKAIPLVRYYSNPKLHSFNSEGTWSRSISLPCHLNFSQYQCQSQHHYFGTKGTKLSTLCKNCEQFGLILTQLNYLGDKLGGKENWRNSPVPSLLWLLTNTTY